MRISARAAGGALHLSGVQQALEEAAVALQRHAQVLGRDVLAAAPLALEPLALGGEALGQPAHDFRDQLVGLLDRAPRIVDEVRLDRLPAALVAGVLVALEQLRRAVALVAL